MADANDRGSALLGSGTYEQTSTSYTSLSRESTDSYDGALSEGEDEEAHVPDIGPDTKLPEITIKVSEGHVIAFHIITNF